MMGDRGPSDLFMAEVAAMEGVAARRIDFEARVLVGTMAGWWNGIAGWQRAYRKWRLLGDLNNG